MATTRRQFLDSIALGGLALGALPHALGAMPPDILEASTPTSADEWDTKWGARLTGKVKALFDVPEVEAGFPVWRASIWAAQYEQVLGQKSTSTALVLRHNAIIMAMQQGYWDKYGVGKAQNITHPLTGQPTDKNPALMGAADGVGDPFNNFALDKFLARGGVALACNLALQFLIVPTIAKADNLTTEQADQAARKWLVPGVILQPSGMFAVIRAEEAGAFYFRAS